MKFREYKIEKIISVSESNPILEFEFIKVKMLVNSYGIIKECERLFNLHEWNMVQQYGYFLA